MSAEKFTFEARSWYRRLKKHDQETVETSEDCLGPEKNIALRSFGFIHKILDAATPDGLITDPAEKAKLGVGRRAFFLLWAAWNDVLTGRYGAAAEHWRSLQESPHFLVAFHWNPELARRWVEARSQVEAKHAYDAIKSALRDDGAYDFAKEWEQRRRADEREVQAFSHVTSRASFATLPTVKDASGADFAYLSRGETDAKTTRENIVRLAHHALDLVRACRVAFADIDAAKAAWEEVGQTFFDEDVIALRDVFVQLGMGEIDSEWIPTAVSEDSRA